jgi:hypothetical protein
MQETKPKVTVKPPWQMWTIVGLVAVIIFLTIKHCKSDGTGVDTTKGDSAFINIDSINAVRKAERQIYIDSINQINIARLHQDNRIAALQGRVKAGARSVAELTKLLKEIPSTTVKEEACDSLIALNEVYTVRVDSLLVAVTEKDSTQALQLRLATDAVADADRAYYAVVDQLLTVKATYDQLKNAAKPRIIVSVGLSGTYNPLVFGLGPAVAVQGKKGGIIHGSYQITNNKPLYSVGYLVPIRLRK